MKTQILKSLILLLLSLKITGQTHVTSAKHFYLAMGTSMSVSELLYKKTNLDGLSPLVGMFAGVAITIGKDVLNNRNSDKLVPDLNKGILGCFGSITGSMIHRVTIDIRDKRTINNNNQIEKVKEFENNFN